MATATQWLSASRPRTLPAAVAPVLTGAGAAVAIGHFSWWKSLLALVVSLALQVGVNYANDYSDGIRGTDARRVGPMRLVGSGAAEPREEGLGEIVGWEDGRGRVSRRIARGLGGE